GVLALAHQPPLHVREGCDDGVDRAVVDRCAELVEGQHAADSNPFLPTRGLTLERQRAVIDAPTEAKEDAWPPNRQPSRRGARAQTRPTFRRCTGSATPRSSSGAWADSRTSRSRSRSSRFSPAV